MPAGTGHLELSGYLSRADEDLTAGVGLRYDHNLRTGIALFAEGHAGYHAGLEYGASAGLSYRW